MIYILSDNKYFYYIAQSLYYTLLCNSIKCKIITSIDECDENYIYIIFNIYTQKKPKKYILYNFEQILINYYDKDKFFDLTKDALLILEYSIVNLEYWIEREKDKSKLIYLPYCIRSDEISDLIKSEKNEKDIDILFVGLLNNRRRLLLEKIDKKYKLEIVTNKFGQELLEYMRRSKICINIHYYTDNSILEVSRLLPMIINDVRILSEYSVDKYYNDQYNDLIEWFDYKKDDINLKINNIYKNINMSASYLDKIIKLEKYESRINRENKDLKEFFRLLN